MSRAPITGPSASRLSLLETLSNQTQKAVENTLMNSNATDRPVASSLLNLSTRCGHSGLEEEEPLQG
jgi:hypothetical protein